MRAGAIFRFDPRLWPFLAMALMALLVGVTGADMNMALRYERNAVLDGSLWRLLTGNLVHFGAVHLALNLAGLALVAALFCRQLSAPQWFATMLICALATTLGLLAFNPRVGWYVGLSGMLHGLFVVGALTLMRERRVAALAYLALVAVKIALDFAGGTGPGVSALIGGHVVVAAHAYGAAGGLAAFTLNFALRPNRWHCL